MRERVYAIIPSSFCLLLFGFFLWLFIFNANLYFAVLDSLGYNPYYYPFIDGGFMFAMKKCWLQGIDVYKSVPCDVIPNNRMAYSPLWQRSPFLPGDPDLQFPVGIVTSILFFLSLMLLPRVRKATELLIYLSVLPSTMIVFAVERNNIDIWIYPFLVIGVATLNHHLFRYFGYFLFFIVTLLKYYPVILFAFILKEKRKVAATLISLLIIGLVVFVYSFAPDVQKSLNNVPSDSPFAGFFGAINIPRALALSYADNPAIIAMTESSLRVILVIGIIYYAIKRSQMPEIQATLARVDGKDMAYLVFGCILISGCYLVIQNLLYRGIFFLPVVLGLLAVHRLALDLPIKKFIRILLGCIIFLMWSETIRHFIDSSTKHLSDVVYRTPLIFVWIIREYAWIYVVHALCAIILAYFLNQNVELNRRLSGLISIIARRDNQNSSAPKKA